MVENPAADGQRRPLGRSSPRRNESRWSADARTSAIRFFNRMRRSPAEVGLRTGRLGASSPSVGQTMVGRERGGASLYRSGATRTASPACSARFRPWRFRRDFGPATRAAIFEWQGSLGSPPVGYLSAGDVAALRASTARAYGRWERARLEGRLPQERPNVISENPTGRYLDERGCLREADGALVRGFRLGCF